MSKVFIIGWDGATFDLIRPWVEQGELPNLAGIMAEGVHGPLRSTMPPWTFPAWSSFMTGKNPGKHGIYDFTRPRPGTYELEFVNGGQRRGETFWRVLSRAGRRVISISVPCTFPPEPVNGVMISGFDAPGLGGRGTHVDARGMHPRELYDELDRQGIRHPIGAFVVNDINRGRPDLAVEHVLETIRAKSATAKYLIARKEWDCAMILFGESDGVGHHFWKYCDPASPLFHDDPRVRDAILRVYKELDRQTGELMELLPPEAVTLVMSDHGFGGTSDWVLYPNCWLRERGLLRFRSGATRWASRALDDVKLHAVARLPGAVKRGLYRLIPRGLGGVEARVRVALIDWAGTEAYFDENPYYPALYVNLKGRQPRGIVEPGAAYEALRDRLIAELQGWRHPETGEPVVERAYRREEVYSGPALDEAPDVVVKWALCRGYSYAFTLSAKSRRLAWIERVDPGRPENLQYFNSKSGTHRDDGIFLARGASIRAGRAIQGARIIDLAPTILGLLGVPVPDDMDGRVLTEALTDDFDREAALQTASAPAQGADAPEAGYYSPEEEAAVSERLKSLGYLE
jgi:predicted AlkP superfamily phosphohydrolase/phosphomutase